MSSNAAPSSRLTVAPHAHESASDSRLPPAPPLSAEFSNVYASRHMRGGLVAVLLFAGACSSGSGVATVPPPPRPDPATVDAFLARLCAAAIPCCGAIGIDDASQASCIKTLQRAAPGLILDMGEACLAEIGSVDGASGCFRLGDTTNDPCIQMFNGHYGGGKPGDACVTDVDCALPKGGISACTGFKCRWLFEAKDGEGPCIADYVGDISFGYDDNAATQGLLCEHGTYCDIARGGSAERKCRAYLGGGQPCEANYECAGICVGPGCDSSLCNGVCQQNPVGGPCAYSRGCASGGYCDSSATCVAVKPAGAACKGADECASLSCQENGVCSGLGHLSYAFAAGLCGLPAILP